MRAGRQAIRQTIRHWALAVLVPAVLWAAAPVFAAPDTVTQMATIDALLAGAYDGQWPCGLLKEHGDVGIGTFHRLEGEMIVLDGVVYQALVDGRVVRVADEVTTPFASVAPFLPDERVELPPGCDYDALKSLLDGKVEGLNVFWGIRVEGRFSAMTVRSVPAQERPYAPLAQVVKNQAVFHLGDVTGTLIGFRCPAYVKGINVPGYHLHFLSRDRRSGGHVLDFELARGAAEIDLYRNLLLMLPEKGSGFEALDLDKDRGKELEDVEQGPGTEAGEKP